MGAAVNDYIHSWGQPVFASEPETVFPIDISRLDSALNLEPNIVLATGDAGCNSALNPKP